MQPASGRVLPGATADAMSETIKLIKPYGRATQARITVLDMLLSATHAISHAELESALLSTGRQIDRVTLYRALEWLVSKNLAHKIPGRDRVWRYSAAYQETNHHVHFHCTHCDQTVCLASTKTDLIRLPKGYQFEESMLVIEGICPRCTGL